MNKVILRQSHLRIVGNECATYTKNPTHGCATDLECVSYLISLVSCENTWRWLSISYNDLVLGIKFTEQQYYNAFHSFLT